ncbi:MAG: long-chain-fatty-acid--CoA ligase [Comamonadaceae bacterium]|nr:MAG: long-chain-fatty-acid--CoA ligase [Comamonadaceae bacterium]
MRLTRWLAKAVRERPADIAIVDADRSLRFDELGDRSARLAGALRSLGVEPGDRVGMLAHNSHRYAEFFMGSWWAGAVVNPVNVRWTAAEVALSLDDCDTRVLLVDDHFAPLAAELRERSRSLRLVVHGGSRSARGEALDHETLLAEAAPVPDAQRGFEDLAAVMYTGGTTGHPKGVMLSHRNLVANALATVGVFPHPGGRVGLISAPLFHIGACAQWLQLLAAPRARTVLLPSFEEAAVLRAIEAEGVTDTFVVPTMLRRLIEHPRFAATRLDSLRTVLYGAAAIDESLLAAAMAALPGVGFQQLYGLTEAAPVVCALAPEMHLPGPAQARRLRSAGHPTAAAEIRIVDAQGRDVPAGETGEIAIQGPSVMQGYWERPEETASALVDGWLRSGDAGRFDEEGLLHVVDRIKDMIVTGGENVYSAEVENALSLHPGVQACAVIGIPDAQWGERVHAVVVPRAGQVLDAPSLVAHCHLHIAGYKCPRSVEFRDELPLSAAGKLQKFQLRAPWWEGRARRVGTTSSPSPS